MRKVQVLALLLALTLSAAQALPPRWEYATLIQDGTYLTWVSPDGNAEAVSGFALERELAALYGDPPVNDASHDLAHALNVLGRHGWELVTIDDGTFVFKRSVTP